jgi:hypothetical protein
MALREVKPLNEKQWKILVNTLKKRPTPEQRKLIKKAVEHGRKLKVVR